MKIPIDELAIQCCAPVHCAAQALCCARGRRQVKCRAWTQGIALSWEGGIPWLDLTGDRWAIPCCLRYGMCGASTSPIRPSAANLERWSPLSHQRPRRLLSSHMLIRWRTAAPKMPLTELQPQQCARHPCLQRSLLSARRTRLHAAIMMVPQSMLLRHQRARDARASQQQRDAHP